MGMSLSGYSYYRAITIDHTKVINTDRSNFPLLFSGIFSYLKTVANGGLVQNASGYDIVFSTDQSTILPFEIENYNATTGEIEAWINIAAISHSSNTILYIYYGNSNVNTSQANASAVWTNDYIAIWHMNGATGASQMDSTSNANTLTEVNSPVQTAGKVDGALSFNGTSQYLSSSGASLNILGDKTIEIWINENSFAVDGSGVAQRFIIDTISALAGYQVTSNAGGIFVFAVNDTGTQYIFSTTGNSISTWYHIVGRYISPGTISLYINGALATNNGGASGWGTGIIGTNVGRRTDASGYANATLDEIRISNVARSPDYIATSYNNQSSPSTFYSVGSQQVNSVSSSFVILSGGINSFISGGVSDG